MPRIRSFFSLKALAVPILTAWVLIPSAARGAVPKLIGTQGSLKDGSGNPVANGTYSVYFRIYDAPSGGNLIWAETTSVSTVNGLFSAIMGSSYPIPDAVFNDTLRYLGTHFPPDPEMTPRQRLVSVGYSYRVSSVNGASGGIITSKVSIGPGHTNTGVNAFVAGESNIASGNWAAVGGGVTNTASGDRATIAGGNNNTASGFVSTIGGGSFNIAHDSATVAGGTTNQATGYESTVGGGGSNIASGGASTVSGGVANTAFGPNSTIGGGSGNTTQNSLATVGGGQSDSAMGKSSTVPGGEANFAGGNYSFAAGRRAKASHLGAFVWADSSADAGFSSTANNQFLIRAKGGVGIGTNTPSRAFSAAQALTLGSNGEGLIEILRTGVAVNGTRIGQFAWTIDDNTTNKHALAIVGDVKGSTAGNRGAEMIFFTKETGGSLAERMRINDSGRVGIGTTSPAKRLHVQGSIQGDTIFANLGVFASNLSGVHIVAGSGELMITATGNAGIGTNNPQGALDVSSTTGALIVPRLTTTQRDALTAVNGMIIYNTTTNQFNFREAGAWVTK